MRNSPISRLFIVTSLVGLEEDNSSAWIVREKGECQTKYLTYEYQHKPPIHDPNALVVPIQVGAKGSNSRKWVVLMARLQTNSRQASSSSCTSVLRWICLPDALFRACCTRVNMPLDPATAGLMLRSSPRSLHNLHKEVVRAFLGMDSSAA